MTTQVAFEWGLICGMQICCLVLVIAFTFKFRQARYWVRRRLRVMEQQERDKMVKKRG